MPRPNTTKARLLKLLQSCVDDDPALPWHSYPCIVWDGPLGAAPGSKIYGMVQIEGSYRQVNKVAYELGKRETSCWDQNEALLRK